MFFLEISVNEGGKRHKLSICIDFTTLPLTWGNPVMSHSISTLKNKEDKILKEIRAWIDDKLDQTRTRFEKSNSVVEVSFRKWCSKWTWTHRSDVFTHLIH